MTFQRSHYEEVLANCSDHIGAITLLKQHRPYLEMIPSMRRPDESVITIPLPLVRVRSSAPSSTTGQSVSGETLCLPADAAILMCDPEWKIKSGVEIFVFIHRPEEDFSELLSRWRHTQISLARGYEWIMPDRHRHIFSDGSDETHPLFVLFPETPDRIQRGLRGAGLPYVIQTLHLTSDDELTDANNPFSSEMLGTDE